MLCHKLCGLKQQALYSQCGGQNTTIQVSAGLRSLPPPAPGAPWGCVGRGHLIRSLPSRHLLLCGCQTSLRLPLVRTLLWDTGLGLRASLRSRCPLAPPPPLPGGTLQADPCNGQAPDQSHDGGEGRMASLHPLSQRLGEETPIDT